MHTVLETGTIGTGFEQALCSAGSKPVLIVPNSDIPHFVTRTPHSITRHYRKPGTTLLMVAGVNSLFTQVNVSLLAAHKSSLGGGAMVLI